MLHTIYQIYVFRERSSLGLPQLGLRRLADINSWNVNETPSQSYVRQMLGVLDQLVSDNILAQPTVLFPVWSLRTKFLEEIFPFSNLWQHGRVNYRVPTARENL